MNILVTGAEGFVGSWLVPHLVDAGHDVVAAVHPEHNPDVHAGWPAAQVVPLDVTDRIAVDQVIEDEAYDAVVHLAAISSAGEGFKDPGSAWQVNVLGTVFLAEALGRRVDSGRTTKLLHISTAEVFGARADHRPFREDDETAPVSPYAASKLAAEVAVMEIHRRTGLHVTIARPFPHTGRGQSTTFVVPAFAERIMLAKKLGAPGVTVGNLEPIRELMHVSDVVRAYALLLESGQPGQVYNVASGKAFSIREIFDTLVELAGHRVISEVDGRLVRPTDIPYLVGDGSKLREATGWAPRVSLKETLSEVMDAQAH